MHGKSIYVFQSKKIDIQNCHDNLFFSLFFQVAKVEFSSRKKAKLKEVLVRLEDHLECVCTSQHHVMEHVEADTGIHVMHTYTECLA